MVTGEPLDHTSFAAAYQQLAYAVARAAPVTAGPFATLLEDHLGVDTADLAVVSASFDVFDHPNLQQAIAALSGVRDVDVVRTVGVRANHGCTAASRWPPSPRRP